MSATAADSAEPADDECRRAVTRAYRELRDRGQPDRFAFEAAVTVYHWHHPEVEATRALDIVHTWLWDGVPH